MKENNMFLNICAIWIGIGLILTFVFFIALYEENTSKEEAFFKLLAAFGWPIFLCLILFSLYKKFKQV